MNTTTKIKVKPSGVLAILFFAVVFISLPNLSYAYTWATFDSGNCDAANVLSGGDLVITKSGTAWKNCMATVGKTSGKWYWEVTYTLDGVGNNTMAGAVTNSYPGTAPLGQDANSFGYDAANGCLWGPTSCVSIPGTYSQGDIIGIALDMDAGEVEFFKNNSTRGVLSGLTGTFYPGVTVYDDQSVLTANFGATTLAFTPPTGYEPGICAESSCSSSPTPSVGTSTDLSLIASSTMLMAANSVVFGTTVVFISMLTFTLWLLMSLLSRR